jgi:2-iminobutanoate/2-iminopropanoate deaminase
MIEAVVTDQAPRPVAPYSQAVVAGGFVFVSGQRPVDPVTMEVVEGFEAQVRQVLTNLSAVLAAAGASMSDVVKVSVFLADLTEFGRFNEIYGQFFGSPPPARTTVATSLRGILVEIDAIAVAQSQVG